MVRHINHSVALKRAIMHNASIKSPGKCLPILQVQARWIIYRPPKEAVISMSITNQSTVLHITAILSVGTLPLFYIQLFPYKPAT